MAVTNDSGGPCFATESGRAWSNLIGMAVTGAAISVFLFFLLRDSAQTGTLLAVCGGLFAAVVLFGLYSVHTSRFRIVFRGNAIHLTNVATKQEFDVWDIPASDCVMKLTDPENDLGSLVIRKTQFRMTKVRNFSAMKQYVEEHFPKG
jgi:hypothetical protein